MAERLTTGARVALSSRLWLWRLAVWALSVGSTYLVFHSPVRIGYPVSMLVFSLAAYFWLEVELRASYKGSVILEALGRASYSLYLVHLVVIGLLIEYPMSGIPIIDVIARLLAIALATSVMFVCVEAPSHRFAREVARSFSWPALVA